MQGSIGGVAPKAIIDAPAALFAELAAVLGKRRRDAGGRFVAA